MDHSGQWRVQLALEGPRGLLQLRGRVACPGLGEQPEALIQAQLDLGLLCREQMVNFQVLVLREGAEKDRRARHWD